MTLKNIAMAGVALVASLAGTAALAANPCPERNITFIVPFAGSGATADTLSRALATELSQVWGKNVIVDNRPGGASVPATHAVVKAEPNGCTFGLVTTAISINTTLMKGKLPYDTLRDLAPVTQLVELPQGIFAAPGFPASDMRGLIAHAKSTGHGVTYGTPGVGTSPHLAGAMLTQLTGAKFEHIPYKGMAPAKIDLLGGRLDLMMGAISTELAAVKAGEVKLLAVAGNKRFPGLPDVPTVGESIPGFRLGGYFGIVTSGKTSPALVEAMAADIRKAMQGPEVKKTLESYNLEAMVTSPKAFRKMIEEETTQLEKVVQQAGLDTR